MDKLLSVSILPCDPEEHMCTLDSGQPDSWWFYHLSELLLELGLPVLSRWTFRVEHGRNKGRFTASSWRFLQDSEICKCLGFVTDLEGELEK